MEVHHLVGAVVTSGCLALTAGAGSIGCMALGGAAAGAATNLWKSKVQKVQPFGWRSLLMDTAVGALGAAAGGAAGRALAPIAGKALAQAAVAGKAALGKAGSAVSKVASAAKSRLSAVKGGALACSFSAATLVLMGDGSTRPISQVAVGDKVTATDPETGEQAAKLVLQQFVHTDDLVDLKTDAGVLETTEDHPFWNATDQAFQRADELDAGDQRLSADSQLVAVGSIRQPADGSTLAYNLAVDDIHTYYVLAGETPVLVHNSGCQNWAANSVKTWGHTFKTHGAGAKNTRALTDRARSTGIQQGQWLDDDAAAALLKGVHVEGAGPRLVRIPDRLGQVIMPDGSVVRARAATIVPSKDGLYRTGFPIVGAN